jgi:hypothetical protein
MLVWPQIPQTGVGQPEPGAGGFDMDGDVPEGIAELVDVLNQMP